MSLTNYLNKSETRSFLKDKIHNPGIDPEPETDVPPKSSSAKRIGTPFDFALRAGLSGRYESITRPIVAESAVNMLGLFGGRKRIDRLFMRVIAFHLSEAR